jgi:hypothetical protein
MAMHAAGEPPYPRLRVEETCVNSDRGSGSGLQQRHGPSDFTSLTDLVSLGFVMFATADEVFEP